MKEIIIEELNLTLYVHQTRHEQENFPNMFTSMLKVFHLDVYSFLDPNDTLPFVTLYVARRFDILPPVLLDIFLSLLLLVKILWLRDLVEIDMSPYPQGDSYWSCRAWYVRVRYILCKGCLYKCYDPIDCRTRVVTFQFLNELIWELKKGNFILMVNFFLS